MLRTPLRRLAGAAGAVLACAPLAGAQSPANAQQFCVPTLTSACFAFAITSEATGFDIWLRNLSPAAENAQDPFVVNRFAIRRVNTPDASGARTDLSSGFSNANVATTGSAQRGFGNWNEDTGSLEFPAVRTLTYTPFGAYGVLGCALPPAPYLAAAGFIAITCADRGSDGWLRIGFDALIGTERPAGAGVDYRTAAPADVAVEVAGCLTSLGSASGVTGPFLGAQVCSASALPSSAVPEPTTAWTVAVGLGGVLAAAGARRARRS